MPLLLSLFLLFAGCAAGPTEQSVFTYYNPRLSQAQTESLTARAKAIESKKENRQKNVSLETLAENALSSHHLVVVRDREPLHYHAHHDGWALVVKGEAEFLLGDSSMVLRPGTSVFIPRGVRHRAVRRGRESLAAFVIFTPPYDGKDMVPVKEESGS